MKNLFRCKECGCIFDENSCGSEHTTYESFYGVASDFADSTDMEYSVCPNCSYDEFEDVEPDNDLEKLCDKHSDWFDNEGNILVDFEVIEDEFYEEYNYIIEIDKDNFKHGYYPNILSVEI